MEQTEINARWQADMEPFFELPPGARPDTASERLEEIFHLD
jgi:L-rhamnose mutarotase